ncbi:PAS domain S-box protein [Rhodoferax sp. 4810]|nr:PAS domain S-box protein [Rhodoferax jenense]
MSFFESGRNAYPFRRSLWMIWLAAALLLVLVAWHVTALIRDDYQRQMATTQRDLANLTRVSQEHADRTLRSADQVVRFVHERYQAMGNKLDLTALTQQGVIDAEIFNQVGIIDAKGIYVLANRPVTGKLDLSDREHFRVHIAADTGTLFVSKPVVGRATGKWSVQLTRRLNHPDGSFAGVVVLSVDPHYFTGIYGELKLGAHGLMSLCGLDGICRARRLGSQEEFGTDISTSQLYAQLGQGQTEGAFTEHSVVDGIERLYYFRKIPGSSLLVVAGVDMGEMLANHDRTRDNLTLQAAMLGALIVVLAGVLTRFLINIRRVIQARLAAQQQAQERTDQLDAIFALSPDGFISFDRNLRITYVSPAFYQMMGQAEQQLVGLDEQDFSAWLSQRCVGEAAFVKLADMRDKLQAGQSDFRQQLEVLAPDRRVLQVGLRCQPSGLVSQILYFRDITVESEVDAMKSEFLTTAAHELRTPMTSILGFTEVLLTQDCDAQAQHEFLSIILARSQLMARILDELLDLARIEARRGKDFRYKLVDVQALVTQVAQSLPLPPGRQPPELSLPAEPLVIMADADKLQQALSNVLINAYKYSSAGSPVLLDVALHTKTGTQHQSAAGVQQVCITTTDSGIGMTPDQTRQMFDRFYRADASGNVLGVGLGLSIVKEIMDLHQGEVRVQSVLGQGTSVALCLPTRIGNP